MSDLDLQLTGLVLVREILSKRGADVSALEPEIDRLRGLKRRPDGSAATGTAGGAERAGVRLARS